MHTVLKKFYKSNDKNNAVNSCYISNDKIMKNNRMISLKSKNNEDFEKQ